MHFLGRGPPGVTYGRPSNVGASPRQPNAVEGYFRRRETLERIQDNQVI